MFIVIELPEPDTFPGLIVQFPVAGNPFKSTLPVATVQLGCITFDVNGAVGVVGCALIVIFEDKPEVQPSTLVTV